MGTRMMCMGTQPQKPVTSQGRCEVCRSCFPSSLQQRANTELGQDNDPMDGNGYFFGAINTQINMSIVVPNGSKCLEPGPLASGVCFCTSIIFKSCPWGMSLDIKFCHGQGEEIDLHRFHLNVLDQVGVVTGFHSLSLSLPPWAPQPSYPFPSCNLGPDATAKFSLEAAMVSHSRTPSVLHSTIIHLLEFPWRRS